MKAAILDTAAKCLPSRASSLGLRVQHSGKSQGLVDSYIQIKKVYHNTYVHIYIQVGLHIQVKKV